MSKKPGYKLKPSGEFIIENYNSSKPFANFFPGIAGPYGIPLWAFYVNRGQGIASFGTKDKDHAILEFFPANKSWQMTPLQGFRTFLKIKTGKKIQGYEPFCDSQRNTTLKLKNRMLITSSGMSLEEENLTHGINIAVEYFTIPGDNYAGLARVITLRNTAKAAKKIQLLDGLPQIIPFGMNNFFLKDMSRTIEAWMKTDNLKNKAPLFRLAVDPQDRPEVIHIEEGNFYLAFHYEKQRPKLFAPIVDPQVIFGNVTDFTYPQNFNNKAKFLYKPQLTSNKTPCGFFYADFKLGPFEEKKFYCLIGYTLNAETLNASLGRVTKYGYLAAKKEENKKIIEGLQDDIKTKSSSILFDLYAKQTYLDNILRGGYPINFKSGVNSTIFYLYSRKHGDLERDYNRFSLEPAYFSQGNGNYRDVNQNRRSDTWFCPEVADENIVSFFSLIQTDGFNPLTVKGVSFSLKDPAQFKEDLKPLVKNESSRENILGFFNKPFTPGEAILFLEKNKIKLNVNHGAFLGLLLNSSLKRQEAEHGEGFWTDHWAYCLDLLENYLALYPEKSKEIIFEKKVFTFFDNTEQVKPRQEKFVLYRGRPRQLHSIGIDPAKKELIRQRSNLPHVVRTQYGKGEIYQTTLINKLLCLAANKMASLDPFGIGIEMEAGKPNWYDSLNGLPGLFGSSLCETLELKRHIIFIRAALKKSPDNEIQLTEEVNDFLLSLNQLVAACVNNNFLFWDKSSFLKEEYRRKTKFGFSGKESSITTGALFEVLDNFLNKLDRGIEKAYDDKKKIYYSYFINEPSEYEASAPHHIKPLKFQQKKLPFFLEANVHALKVTSDIGDAKNLYQALKNSALYDKKLKMYKVSAELKTMPEEIGRCRVFSPGWLENESIWLHMEYKYLLEILRSGLYEEFYAEFKNVLVPFQNPARYGRSILENSSFLVSSAFPDKALHGNGFVARLSGSTAEFLSIWLLMNLGKAPFFLNEKDELCLRFNPALAGWLFDKKGNYTFNFLSKVDVVYHNRLKKNTFGKNAAKLTRIYFTDKDNNLVEINSEVIPSPYAEQIRSRQIKQIDIYLE